jgi:hypothetical protein
MVPVVVYLFLEALYFLLERGVSLHYFLEGAADFVQLVGLALQQVLGPTRPPPPPR